MRLNGYESVQKRKQSKKKIDSRLCVREVANLMKNEARHKERFECQYRQRTLKHEINVVSYELEREIAEKRTEIP